MQVVVYFALRAQLPKDIKAKEPNGKVRFFLISNYISPIAPNACK